jgi:hypothetical protein
MLLRTGALMDPQRSGECSDARIGGMMDDVYALQGPMSGSQHARLLKAVDDRDRAVASVARFRTPHGVPATVADGIHAIGPDLAPGTYKADSPSSTCRWARLRGFSGEPADVISSGASSGKPLIAVIAKDDAAFESRSCGEWRREGAPGQ